MNTLCLWESVVAWVYASFSLCKESQQLHERNERFAMNFRVLGLLESMRQIFSCKNSIVGVFIF